MQADIQRKLRKNQPKSTKKIIGNLISNIHLWAGLVAGIVLLTVALSGALLAFEEEITPILYRKEQKVNPIDATLSINALIAKAEKVYPERKIFRIKQYADPERSVKVLYGTKKGGYTYAYLDPYRGTVLSKGEEAHRFFPIILDLHRLLLAGEPGKVITGLSCCLTILLAFSGIYLWWPSSKKILKQRMKIKRGSSGKRFIWDLHAVGGFYSAFFLLIICFTGLVWSYEWVEKQIFIWTDGKIEKELKITNRDASASLSTAIFNRIKDTCDNIFPYRGNILLTMPAKRGLPITLSKENLEEKVMTTDQAYFDSSTGDLLMTRPFSAQSTGSKIRKMVKPIHTGSLLGWPTKIISFLTALITASLPITGFLIWLNKMKKKSPRKRKFNDMRKQSPHTLSSTNIENTVHL